MDRQLVVILMKLVRAYQKQAEEQALATVKWRTKLGAIEGDLLKLVEEDVELATAVSLEDLMK